MAIPLPRGQVWQYPNDRFLIERDLRVIHYDVPGPE